MAVQNQNELEALATEVREETIEKANTKTRIGTLFFNLVQTLFEKIKVGVKTSNILVFDKVAGYRHGSFGNPLTGEIVLDSTGAVEGGVCVAIWSGAINPVITGGLVESTIGKIKTQGVYTLYIHHISGRFNINIFNADEDVNAPAVPTINSIT